VAADKSKHGTLSAEDGLRMGADFLAR